MLPRLLQTLRHLRPRQITYQVYYRLTGRLGENFARTHDKVRGAGAQVQGKLIKAKPLPPTSKEEEATANALPVRLEGGAKFRFLNQEVSFPDPAAIDWNYAPNGKLLTYNLNYFEYLRQPGLDSTTAQQLIDSWIAAEATHKDGWEPYPLSLRLVNWLQFYRLARVPVPAHVTSSVRRQYAALQRKVEYHLGGNHLLENAIALALTAHYLDDAAGLKKADKLLQTELKEQYLPDGAHYERSVMYHLVLLWRQLDLYAWREAGSAPISGLREQIERQLGWASRMITEDGRYPHFNDSTDGIAPAWSAVRAYAASLDIKANPFAGENAAGYHRWSFGQTDVWLDAGAIGPDYIPGHAHADNLTFSLHHNGRPLIVDPAISTYEKNARRAWERSTAAHNTVVVDGQNSSDVWGGFRVGRRATTRVTRLTDTELVAEHNGYRPTVHRRTFTRTATGLRITDELAGGAERGVAYLHFAPGISPEFTAQGCRVGEAFISFAGADETDIQPYQLALGFNRLADAEALSVTFAGRLVTTIDFPTAP